jgi:hypothetical protein
MKQALFIAVLMISQAGVSFSKENGTQSVSGLMDQVKRYCSEEGSSRSAQCLGAYFTYRCTVNFIGSDPLYLDDCISATSDLVDLLDLTQMPDDGRDQSALQLRQVAFSRKLVHAFLTPASEFKRTMDQLEQSFNDSYESNRPHSLWMQILNESKWDRESALEKMVTWFQDFSAPFYLWLLEIESKKTKNQWKRETLTSNAESLYSFHNLLVKNRILQNRNPMFQLYPEVKGVKHLSPLAHHFYTPAYLSLKLNRMGYSKEVAFYAAFLFNTTYEFIKLDRKMGTHRWPMRDPLSFDRIKHALQVEKIYTGYAGALYGVGMSDKALNFQYFSKRLASDPSGFVSTVHHSGF